MARTAATRRFLFAAALLVGPAACNDESGDDRSPASPAAGATADLAELPVPRTEVSGAAWDGGLVVAGGLTPDGAASALVHTFDADRNRWVAGPELPVPLHHAGMAVAGERVYLAGGFTNGPGQPWQARADVWSLGPGEQAWRAEPLLPGGPRGALGLAAAGPLLVAMGGVAADGAAVGTAEVYDTGTGAWRAGPPLALPREHLAAAARDGRVYAIAGRAAGQGNFTAVESIDPARDERWRSEPDLADSRGGIAAAAVEGRLCVAGGEEAAGTIASVECLDGDNWTRAARLDKPRHGLAVMALDGRLHVVAGGEQPGLFVSGVHEALEV
jgi:hypothetical protein